MVRLKSKKTVSTAASLNPLSGTKFTFALPETDAPTPFNEDLKAAEESVKNLQLEDSASSGGVIMSFFR